MPDLTTSDDRVAEALEFITRAGDVDGAHHKQWVIDQLARILAGDQYDEFIAQLCDGEDGPETYGWDVGIPM